MTVLKLDLQAGHLRSRLGLMRTIERRNPAHIDSMIPPKQRRAKPNPLLKRLKTREGILPLRRGRLNGRLHQVLELITEPETPNTDQSQTKKEGAAIRT
jgi:hypothetical protein